MIALLTDPYFLGFVGLPAIGAVVGWAVKQLVWPTLVRSVVASAGVGAMQALAEAKAADARVDALRHELTERFNTVEERYDDEIDDLRDAWSRRHEP